MGVHRQTIKPWWDPNDPLEEGFRILARIILRKIMAQRAAEQALCKMETVTVDTPMHNVQQGDNNGNVQDK